MEPFATSSFPSLTRALAEALVDVVWFVDGCDDGQMDPDDAVKLLEGVAALLGRLTADQRDELLRLISAMTHAEPDSARRAFLEQFPEGLGLLDAER